MRSTVRNCGDRKQAMYPSSDIHRASLTILTLGNKANLCGALGISARPASRDLSPLRRLCLSYKSEHLSGSHVIVAESGALMGVRVAEAALTTL
jgi:hypothetical protein